MQPDNTSWNRDRAVGERLAFSLAETQQIIAHLRRNHAHHDLCLFSVGIDSMLRCSDLLPLKISDVMAPDGRIRWRQKKTGRNVYPVLTPLTHTAIERWVEVSGKFSDHYLFTRDKPIDARPLSSGYYRTLIKRWASDIGLNPERFSTHSLRRTKPSYLYHYGFSDLEHIARLLGHGTTDTTSRYLGIQQKEAERHALAGDIFTAELGAPIAGHPLLREFLKPEFLDQFAEALCTRMSTKSPDFIDENYKKGRE